MVTYILLSRKSSSNNADPVTPTPIANLPDIIPGVIVPTTEIKPGELDVVAVSPADMSTNLTTTVPIGITFSQFFKKEDIEFMISPKISYSQVIDNNKLIITPNEDYQPHTLYYYRVKFTKDIDKVRLYKFITAGEGPLIVPDTAPEEEDINRFEEKVRIERPDIYVQNNTPYENSQFGITGTFAKESPAHFEFKVLLKGANKNDSRGAFIIWLQSLDLTDAQIASLDITYE